MTIRGLMAAVAVVTMAVPVAAHEVWIERDAGGPARIYLGEPAEPVPSGGDPEFHRLQKPQVFHAGGPVTAAVRRSDHIEVPVPGKGDVRLRDDGIFAPWKEEAGLKGAIFYAREGRSEAAGKLDLELVPVAPGGDRVTLMFRGKPVPDAPITVIAPDRWQKTFRTDARGQVDLPHKGAGRYIVGGSHDEKAAAKIGGQDVSAIVHVTTLSFTR